MARTATTTARMQTDRTPREAAVIARADRFSVYLFVSRDNKHVSFHPTRAEAREVAAELAAQVRKPAIIYALAGEYEQAFLEAVSPNAVRAG